MRNRFESSAGFESESPKMQQFEKPPRVVSDEDTGVLDPMIEKMRRPMQRILEGMREHLENGDYTIIIGEDASGRIPINIMRNVINQIYDLHGYVRPKVLFFAGFGRMSGTVAQVEEKVDDMRERIKDAVQKTDEKGDSVEKPPRALVVTEYIASGDGMRKFVSALKKADVPYDIATVGTQRSAYTPEPDELKEKLGCDIFFGELGKVPDIYYRGRSMSGVYKRPSDLYALPLTNSEFYREDFSFVATDRQEVNRRMRLARRDAKKLAEELYNEYTKKK